MQKPHRLNIKVDIGKAKKLQLMLANKVILRDKYSIIRRIACVDASYKGDIVYAIAGLFSYPSLKLEKCILVVDKVVFPYIPGLLAFREAPYYIKALVRLGLNNFDLIIVDGHGRAHPRKLGIASHIGVVLKKPSIGVAKRKLYGEIISINGKEYIIDPTTKEKLGMVLTSIRGKKIFVSPGNMVSVESAYMLVKKMIRKHYLPEPLYMIDKMTKQVRDNKSVCGGPAGI